MTQDAAAPGPAADFEPVARRLTGPRWGFHALCLVVALPWLWLASTPGYPVAWYGLALVVFVLAVAWIVWVIACVAQQRPFSPWLLVAPIGGLLVLLAFMTHAPLKARWAFSASAFDAAMAVAPELGPRDESGYFEEPVKVGSYWISSVTTDYGRMTFQEESGNLCGSTSFVNAPNGIPGSESTGVVSLGGSWYAVNEYC
jgi:hypothetical protein